MIADLPNVFLLFPYNLSFSFFKAPNAPNCEHLLYFQQIFLYPFKSFLSPAFSTFIL